MQRRIWQIASRLPSPKCGAGARGSAAAAAPPPPPSSGARGHLLLRQEEPSPNRFQPDFFLPVSFFSRPAPLPQYVFLLSDLRLLQPEPSQGSALRGFSSLRLRARTRALRRAKQRRKTCRRAFASPLLTPFAQTQASLGGPSQDWGKLLPSRQPSWIWRRHPRWLWN